MSEQVRKLPEQESRRGEASVREVPVHRSPAKDITALMAEIRERIQADVEGTRDKRPDLSRAAGRLGKDQASREGALQYSEDLRFLNQNYAFDAQMTPAVIPSHRGGFVGRLIPKIKRVGRAILRKLFLVDYFAAQRRFNEHLVRYLNDIGRYIDARDTEVVRRIDRVDDESRLGLVSLQRELMSVAHDRVAALDTMVRGLEGIVNNMGRYNDPNPPRATESQERVATPDMSYLLLENRYRGGELEIERRISIYPEIFAAAPGAVLEIGSGRGELQRLFKEKGITSYGVDLDTVMVNVANAQGCDTRYGDGIAHLRSLPDASLGGLIAVQVVEHLTRAQLGELCELATRKLKKGAKIVFETINPQSLLALSSNYFRDPTHVWPMHPDTLGYTATLAGLKIVETRYLSPVSANFLLKELPMNPGYEPAVADAVERINRNFEQLNKLLYGFQDYALVLEVE